MISAPMFGPREVPRQVRVFLALGMSLVAFPLQASDTAPTAGNLVDLGLMIAGEVVVGLTLGTGVMMLFVGMQVAGQIMGQMSGMQLADLFNPSFSEQSSVFGKLLDLVALGVFFSIGGHRQVIAAVLDSFAWMPAGEAAFHPDMLDLVTGALTQSFLFGLRASAPVLASLLCSMVVLGLLGRALPQLNIFALGFSLNSSVMLLTLWISLSVVGWLFHDEAMEAIQSFRHMLGG